MGERSQESSSDSLDDMFEPIFSEMSDDDMDELTPYTSDKQRLAEKRRRAEQRLEEKRLREELGYYDLELGDY
ncbi:PA3496 family putative envelope integrity protein [Haliea sp. E17]|uniref:PA3496 family putative envelope integrity protein n=1 Tax=Haliea sp. E17 TaxID=3401576 RepID=UPI003AAB702F